MVNINGEAEDERQILIKYLLNLSSPSKKNEFEGNVTVKITIRTRKTKLSLITD